MSSEDTIEELAEFRTDLAPEPVEFATIRPAGYDDVEPIPLCLVLHGGGGSRENLVRNRDLYASMWENGELSPMLLAMPSTGELSFYLDRLAPGGLLGRRRGARLSEGRR